MKVFIFEGFGIVARSFVDVVVGALIEVRAKLLFDRLFEMSCAARWVSLFEFSILKSILIVLKFKILHIYIVHVCSKK
jgi:hypothetical protein